MALVPVLLFVVVLSMIALATAGHGRAVHRALQRQNDDQLERAALEYGFAVVESNLRRRLASATPVRRDEVFGENAGVAMAAGFPPDDFPVPFSRGSLRVACHVVPSSRVSSVITVAGGDPAAGENPRRPQATTRRVVHLPEVGEDELAGVLGEHFDESPGDALLQSMAAAIDAGSYDDEDELAGRVSEILDGTSLSTEQRESLARGVDALPRLRRTNSHASRATGRDRGSFPCAGSVLSPRLSGRFVLRARCEGQSGRTVTAQREVVLLERMQLAFQSDWLRPGSRQTGGCELDGVVLGPEVVGGGDWEFGVPEFHRAPAATNPSQLVWRRSPPGVLGTSEDRGVLVFRTRGSEPLAFEEVTALQAAPAPPAAVPLLVPLPGHGIHVVIDGNGAMSVFANDEMVAEGQLPEFAGMALFGASNVGIDGVPFHDLLVPTDGGIWSVPVKRARQCHLDLGGHLLLAPRPPTTDTRFRAPLAGSLAASWDGLPFPAGGTVNASGSVLHGSDLSDVVVDGVYLSPLRGETLRYSTFESGVGVGELATVSGRGSLLVKPERSAAESAEPQRTRVVMLLTQIFRVTLDVDAPWIAANHPQHPSAGDIVSIVREGPAQRTGVVTSRLERDVAAGRWMHRREMEVYGSPWGIRVWVGSPTVELPTWVLPATVGGMVMSSQAVVDDIGIGGEWQRLELAWGDLGEAWISRDAEPGALIDDVIESPVTGSAFHVESEDWILEVGGELGGKAFRGTVRELLLDDRGIQEQGQGGPVEDASIFSAVTADHRPHVRWLLPRSFAPGDSLRSMGVLGDLPDGTNLRWVIEERGDHGSTFTEHIGKRVTAFSNERLGDVDLAVSLWLSPDPARRRTPLVEALVAEWLPAPSERLPPRVTPKRSDDDTP